MPAPIRPTPRTPPVAPKGGYTVRRGDTLSAIAGQVLGDSRRWKELHALNRALIGADPGALRPGMVLKLPAAPAPEPAKPQPQPAQGWSAEMTREFQAFVAVQTEKLAAEGIEIDCADFAVKLVADFAAAHGLPNPLASAGTWHRYTAARTGGLPNVKGDNWVLTGVSADRLAKELSRRVNDADEDGIAGFDAATGAVDVADLSPGDLLFYDWDGDGRVNHTMNVLDVAADGTVTVAYGTYDNLAPGTPLVWENLDLQPIQIAKLKPGTAAYRKYLEAGNMLVGVHRYGWMPDKPKPVAPPEPPPAPAPEPAWWQKALDWLLAPFRPRPRMTAELPGLDKGIA